MKRILSLTLALLMLVITCLAIVSCNDDEVDTSEKTFTFTVVHADGTTKDFTITTTEAILADALVNEGIIAGEDGPYGLYVKTVDGETLDYETDGKYWSLYIDGQYAVTGVDSTEIKDGATYSFKAE